jgi:hypothetical protein
VVVDSGRVIEVLVLVLVDVVGAGEDCVVAGPQATFWPGQ